MNEMEVEKALDALAETACADPVFLGDFPVHLLRAYQASPSQIARLIKDNDARAAKASGGGLLDTGALAGIAEFVWPKQMHYRAAAPGCVHETVEALRAAQKPKAIPGKTGPRFMVSTDGAAFAAIDLRGGDRFKGEMLTDLVEEYDFLQPMFGIERYTPPSEQEADVKAARHMREIHDAVVAHDQIWSRPDHAEALNTFMIRLLFCLFADGSGVFPPKHGAEKPFTRIMDWHGRDKDGSKTQGALQKTFRVLDWREDDARRQEMDPRYRDLPYANGKLFEDDLAVPAFNGRAQRALRRALELDWGEINADIFGSMIQAIAGEGDRSHYGMHYTSVPNIMKVLGPLFVDGLKDDLATAGTDRRKLQSLIERVAAIHVFDPACGSGNFLIIAYRELRAIETAALATIHGTQRQLGIASKIRLDHFHGVDPVDFACRTARLSLWISQIQADRKLAEIGMEPPAILPLHDAGDIRQASALDIDWGSVVPVGVSEAYIVGNPPYIGSSYQSSEQKSELERIFQDKLSSWRNLDYISAWFELASNHVATTGSRAAFVTTSSICQGESVPMLWPHIFNKGVEISFAHTSFKWSNSAARNAGVACAIIGLRKIDKTLSKHIFSPSIRENETYVVRSVRNINAYLTDGDNIVVNKHMKPINDMPVMQLGNVPRDGGALLLTPDEVISEIKRDSRISVYIKPITGSREIINGIDRFCLWIDDKDLESAREITSIRERIERVRQARLASPAPLIRSQADIPHRFGQIQITKPCRILAVPAVFSEDREYMTVSYFDGLITNRAFGIVNAPPMVMAVLSSRMHLAWARAVSGRLENRISYGSTQVYNPYPLPRVVGNENEVLDGLGLRLIDVRQPYIDDGRNLAWLYDPKTMPEDLRAVHDELDEEFESMYVGRRFKDDAERLEHMFRLYAKMKG